MFTSELTHEGHVRRFSIQPAQDDGWELRVEEDSRLLRHARYTDWHRVERALLRIEDEMRALEDLGWRAPDGHRSSLNR